MINLKYVINLTEGFNPFVPLPFTGIKELQYEMFKFSGGEWNIKITDEVLSTEDLEAFISCKVKTADDIMKILLTVDALRRLDITKISLAMPYLPYARQDRVCNVGEALSLDVFAALINSQNFHKVYMLDVHSEVGAALIKKSVNISNQLLVANTIDCIDSPNLVLVSPDSGANKKMNKLSEALGDIPVVKCDKKRKLSDGSLSGFEVFAEDLEGKDCLIVDDICDGGRTFIGIAAALKAKNAGKLYLCVSHGIFSSTVESLLTWFEDIFTSDSFTDKNDSIHVIYLPFRVQI